MTAERLVNRDAACKLIVPARKKMMIHAWKIRHRQTMATLPVNQIRGQPATLPCSRKLLP